MDVHIKFLRRLYVNMVLYHFHLAKNLSLFFGIGARHKRPRLLFLWLQAVAVWPSALGHAD